MIEGIVVDTFVRVNFPTASRYYYGLIKGFDSERYKVSLVDGMSPHERNIAASSCEEPNRIEELLYF